MQWGALRARSSRPPQQPPGLAGSRMLRPPRAPLAVPRCPHRPHGGRLSQPEALQQGSTGAEETRRGRVSPPARGGRVEGKAAVCSAHKPLYAPRGARQEGEAEAPCPRRPQCGSSAPVTDSGSSTPGCTGEWEPQVGNPREANWAPPPAPPTTSPAPAAGSCATGSC